jgi:hypothetical protein
LPRPARCPSGLIARAPDVPVNHMLEAWSVIDDG